MKTRKKLVEFLMDHFNVALTPTGCDIFADKLIEAGLVQLDKPKEWWICSRHKYAMPYRSMRGDFCKGYELEVEKYGGMQNIPPCDFFKTLEEIE